MSNVFVVKGINPVGRVVEIVVIADSAGDAKTKAEDVGLKHIVVREAKIGDPLPPLDEGPANPG